MKPRLTWEDVMHRVVEAIAWLQIAASPILISLGLGAVSNYVLSPPWGPILGVAVLMLGVWVGVRGAERVRRTKGTLEYMAMLDASPDLDNFVPIEKKEGEAK